jgi:hypothetical protein
MIIDSSSLDLFIAEFIKAGSETDKHFLDHFFTGKCDSFAVGILGLLSSAGVESSLVAIERKTTFYCYDDDLSVDFDSVDYEESNNLSHVVVEAFGTCWDALGSDADVRFETDWTDDENGVTAFSYSAIDIPSLIALRVKKEESFDADLADDLLEKMTQAQSISVGQCASRRFKSP